MYSNITEAEWKIMKILWEKAPLTLKEIVNNLKQETSWSNTTVRTLIVRLMEKEIIKADKSTGNFKYAPIIKKEESQLHEAEQFINTVFDGSMGMFITAFSKKGKLSKEDEKELMKIIEKLKED
jgi:BlaI family penicillinase repressor